MMTFKKGRKLFLKAKEYNWLGTSYFFDVGRTKIGNDLFILKVECKSLRRKTRVHNEHSRVLKNLNYIFNLVMGKETNKNSKKKVKINNTIHYLT